jgi:hypothetical protein
MYISKWLLSIPGLFNPGERAPDTHWIGGCVGLRAGLDDMEKWKIVSMQEIEPRPSSPQPVGIPTELSRLLSVILVVVFERKIRKCKSTNTAHLELRTCWWRKNYYGWWNEINVGWGEHDPPSSLPDTSQTYNMLILVSAEPTSSLRFV